MQKSIECTNLNLPSEQPISTRRQSNYVRFTDADIEELVRFGYDLGYLLEPELMDTDQEHPIRFKVISRVNPAAYGWISKVIEYKDDKWQEGFLYGFYRKGMFFNKYPISFSINSHQVRGIMKRKVTQNPRLETYFRTIFGILDLEPQINPLNFIFSWLSACIFSKTITI